MRIRSTAVRNALIAGSAMAAAISVCRHADARTIMAGVAAASYLDIDCFSVYYGSLTNSCGQQKLLTFPLFVDNGGYKTVVVTARSDSGSATVTCQAVGRLKNGWTNLASGNVSLPYFGAYADLTLTGAYVPAGGQLEVTCYLDPGTQVTVLNWNP